MPAGPETRILLIACRANPLWLCDRRLRLSYRLAALAIAMPQSGR